ncbi:MAG: hypothetical protein A3B68_01375 [Candidatus Melainabacteria bacterium RIFCSPHIGHO2_02_FULL_34_12]|nr:MAG: hypothetical protein A3B68_01375 [Candidatus Melainabacteria bacterium RIFCSPHIGHO2_02_FULL_34_12]
MGAILSIDFGTKRIGLAVSDSTRTFAFPYGTIENKNHEYVFLNIKNIISEKEVDLIIIGMPYRRGIPMCMPTGKKAEKQRNRETEKSKKVSMEDIISSFVNKLRERVNIPVEIVDEKLSSFAAEENLKESGISSKEIKRFVDQEAARLILLEFLQNR